MVDLIYNLVYTKFALSQGAKNPKKLNVASQKLLFGGAFNIKRNLSKCQVLLRENMCAVPVKLSHPRKREMAARLA